LLNKSFTALLLMAFLANYEAGGREGDERYIKITPNIKICNKNL
jgi:hypothetical protein